VVYAREYLYMKELSDRGVLGKIQFVRPAISRTWTVPNYWPVFHRCGMPHIAVGPVCGLTNATAEYVSCFGSGTIRKELIAQYQSPFAVETRTSNSKTQT
jgi:hypothetical protein